MDIDQTYTDEFHSKPTTSDTAIVNNTVRSTVYGASELRGIVKDEIDDFRDELMSENFRFKAEMLKEFMQMRVF